MMTLTMSRVMISSKGGLATTSSTASEVMTLCMEMKVMMNYMESWEMMRYMEGMEMIY